MLEYETEPAVAPTSVPLIPRMFNWEELPELVVKLELLFDPVNKPVVMTVTDVSVFCWRLTLVPLRLKLVGITTSVS